MAKPTKYIKMFVVQGNYGYGHGWEDLTASENYKEARADLKAYRENDGYGSHRLITRRVRRQIDQGYVPEGWNEITA